MSQAFWLRFDPANAQGPPILERVERGTQLDATGGDVEKLLKFAAAAGLGFA
jgi:hypothetical protein